MVVYSWKSSILSSRWINVSWKGSHRLQIALEFSFCLPPNILPGILSEYISATHPFPNQPGWFAAPAGILSSCSFALSSWKVFFLPFSAYENFIHLSESSPNTKGHSHWSLPYFLVIIYKEPWGTESLSSRSSWSNTGDGEENKNTQQSVVGAMKMSALSTLLSDWPWKNGLKMH